MAMHQKHRILYILLAVLLTLSSSFATDPAAPSVYEILPQFGLPRGLLPDQVKSYTLLNNGEFEVNLEKPCYVQFDCVVYYEKKITGKLSLGSITNLKGIQVQRFYLWFDVDEIRVDLPPSDSIYFTFGIINKQLDVGQFQIVHSCRAKKKVYTLYADSFKNFLQIAGPVHDVQLLLTE